MLVGVSDSAVILLFEFVGCASRIGIATLPEAFDELLALIIGGKLFECLPLFTSDNVRDFLVDPLLVRASQFLRCGFVSPHLFFVALLFWCSLEGNGCCA